MGHAPKAAPVVLCPYCGAAAQHILSSAEIYRGRDYGPMWVCWRCEAWVGCHKGTDRPLGRLANKDLRDWKVKAHAAFDPLWKRNLEKRRQERGPDYPQGAARGSGYKWLAEQLGIPQKDCHVGLFDVEMCKRVVDICTPFTRRLAA